MATSHFSPQVIRKAPPPPVPQLVSPSSKSGLSRSASSITNGRSQLSSAANSSGGGVLNVDLLPVAGEGGGGGGGAGGTRSDEFGFEKMHRLLGVPILADLKARKMAMEKSDQPLIMF